MKKFIILLVLSLFSSLSFSNIDCAKDKLILDLAEKKHLYEALDKAPELVEVWTRFERHGVRTNPEFLKKFKNEATPEQQDALIDFYTNPGGVNAPAGKKFSVDYSTTKNIDGEDITIHYDEYGFPNFLDHSPGREYVLVFDDLVGGPGELRRAKVALISNLPDTVREVSPGSNQVEILVGGDWVRHSIHHHQDGRSLIPIPTKIHNVGSGGFPHTGGSAIIDRGLQGFFDAPSF